MITTVSPPKAAEYYETKLEFTIDPHRLHEELESGNFNIIDVRDEGSFRKGHIPGAINLPESKWLTFNGLSRDKTNVIYCYSLTCLLASRAALKFAENDYPVTELLGGYEAWNNSNFPVER